MPKATLKFDLPDEQWEFDRACQGESSYMILTELDQELRSLIKYGHGFKTADEVLEKMREQLRIYCIERNIQLD